jgi:hypothetical protein
MTTPYLTALSNAFQEQLVPGIQDLSAAADPLFPLIVEDRSVVAKDPINDDYRVYYNYTSSLAGGLQFSSISNNDMTLDGTDRANVIDTLPAFPGIRDAAFPTIGRYSVGLTSVRGTVSMPFAALQANQLPGALNDMPALIMRKHIEMVSHIMTCAWYADQSGGLAQLGEQANLSSTASGNTCTITCTSGNLIVAGRIRRLKPGLYVDLLKSDFSAKINANGFALIIGAINAKNGTTAIKLYFESSTDAAACAVEADIAGGWFTPRNAVQTLAANKSTLPCGYQHFIVDTGVLYGNYGSLNISTVPELQSVVASGVGDLTEQTLNQYITLFNEAVGGDIDTMFTSGGVILNLLGNPTTQNMYTMERQGQPARLRLGWDGVDYTFDGRTYKLYQSPFVSKGHFVGLKTAGGNIKRHYPPTIPGTGKTPSADEAIQWIGPMVGDSIWMPVINSDGRVTEGLQAPYMINKQITAADPRGLLLTGCTDDSIGA